MAGSRKEQVPTTPLEIAYTAWMSAAAEKTGSDAALARFLHRRVNSDPDNYRPRLKEEDLRWLEKGNLEAKYITKFRTWRARATLPSSPGLAEALTEIIEEMDLPVPQDSKEWPNFAQVLKLLASEREGPYQRGGEAMQARARIERDLNQRTLLTTDQCLVRDLDPVELGLGSWMFDGALPRYVRRDADSVVKESLDGGVPGITVIAGPPKSGKTRSMLEILQTELPDKTIWWVNPAPRVLPQIVSTFRKDRQNKPDLIVIDDAHLCRANPADGLTATRLRELGRASRVILTLHDSDLAAWRTQTLKRSSTRVGSSTARMADELSFGADRDLVELLEAHLIEFRPDLHDVELEAASDIYPPGEHAGLDLTRMAEVFASIPELLALAEQWQMQGGIHEALIEAALDTAIAYPNGTTPEIIETLTKIHFDRVDPNGIWDANSYRDVLTEATTGIGGHRSPHAILVKRPGTGHTLLEALTPHLVHENRSIEHLSSAPFLDALAQLSIGYWALEQKQTEIARMHWIGAADEGNFAAMYSLGVLESNEGNPIQARHWYEKAAELGNTSAMGNIGFLENEAGNIDQARYWWEKAAELGNTSAIYNIGFLENEAGNIDQARYWWEKAAKLGDTNAMFGIGVLERKAGNIDQARHWYEKAAALGHSNAMFGIGVLQNDAGNTDQARHWYEKAAEHGNSNAMYNIGAIERKTGNTNQARHWYEKAAKLGNSTATFNIGALEHDAGNTDQARHWYKKAAELGHSDAMFGIGVLENDAGNTDQARHWYEKAAKLGDTDAMGIIGVLENDAGNTDQARHWYEKAAKLGNSNAMFSIGLLESNAGNIDQAQHWWEKAAELGNTNAMYSIGFLERQDGNIITARHWNKQAAELGNSTAMCTIGVLEINAGNIDQARYWWEKAAELGNTDSMKNLATLERKAGNINQTRYWLEKAAELGLREARERDQEFGLADQEKDSELSADSDSEAREEAKDEEE